MHQEPFGFQRGHLSAFGHQGTKTLVLSLGAGISLPPSLPLAHARHSLCEHQACWKPLMTCGQHFPVTPSPSQNAALPGLRRSAHHAQHPPLPRSTVRELGGRDTSPGLLLLSPHIPCPSSPELRSQGPTPPRRRSVLGPRPPQDLRMMGHRVPGSYKGLVWSTRFPRAQPPQPAVQHLAVPHTCVSGHWRRAAPRLGASSGPETSWKVRSGGFCV